MILREVRAFVLYFVFYFCYRRSAAELEAAATKAIFERMQKKLGGEHRTLNERLASCGRTLWRDKQADAAGAGVSGSPEIVLRPSLIEELDKELWENILELSVKVEGDV